MSYEYRRAGLDDIGLLVATRVTVLLAANLLPGDTDMTEVAESSRVYYERALSDGSHTAYLVFDGEKVIGTGGVSYYTVMPTFHNRTGRKAYIMNMYTSPEYRRQGIAMKTLSLLVDDALKRGATDISLEATAAGRPLYERFGFAADGSNMILPSELAETLANNGKS